MNIYINSKQENVPENVKSVAQLLSFLHIGNQGTGVAINNRLIKASDRDSTFLKEDDNVIIISATYGG